ncbi:hypothetical protein WJX74_007403 [Apatococcus lobatus]
MKEKPGPAILRGHEYYEFVADLAAGAFGFVQKARDKETNDLVAIKFMVRGKKTITRNVLREITNHQRLLHPHIVQFKEVFLTNTHLAIVMEFAAGGDLFTRVRDHNGMTENEARWFFQQLIIGIDYAHKMGVVNRDIKLENSLLDGSKKPLLKLCDFGYSKSNIDSVPKSNVGTPGYAGPEVISGLREYNGQLADIWSCGCVLYVMVFCEYPFERDGDPPAAHRRNAIVSQRIRNADYKIPDKPETSPELKDLIRRILVADPKHRATILDIIAHPWFSKGLPRGVLDMNNKLVAEKQHAGYQTEEEIQDIWEQATHASPAQNQHIDHMIDAEYMDINEG